MSALPASRTSLNAKNQLKFTAICPEHQKASSKILAEQGDFWGKPEFWVFSCPEAGKHAFRAAVSTLNPRTAEEKAAVIQKLLSEKALKVARGQQ